MDPGLAQCFVFPDHLLVSHPLWPSMPSGSQLTTCQNLLFGFSSGRLIQSLPAQPLTDSQHHYGSVHSAHSSGYQNPLQGLTLSAASAAASSAASAALMRRPADVPAYLHSRNSLPSCGSPPTMITYVLCCVQRFVTLALFEMLYSIDAVQASAYSKLGLKSRFSSPPCHQD